LITNIVGYNSGSVEGYFKRGVPCGAVYSKSGINFVVVTIDDNEFVVMASDLEELALDIGTEELSAHGRSPEDT